MGEMADRAIEEEMYGERCMDCDETPCICDDDEDFELDDACDECGGSFCDGCGACPDCDGCECEEEE